MSKNYRGSRRKRSGTIMVVMLIVIIILSIVLAVVLTKPTSEKQVVGQQVGITEDWNRIGEEYSGKVFPKGTIMVLTEDNSSYLPILKDGHDPEAREGIAIFIEAKAISFKGEVLVKSWEKDFSNITMERDLVLTFERETGIINPAFYLIR
jgi:hypothetical protein